MNETITVHVKLDAATFRRFAVFDTFRLKRKWQKPVLFTLILAAFAFAAFALKREQSLFIGCVLLTVGLGLPLVYFGSFFAQLDAQVKAQKLDKPRAVYTLAFTPQDIRIRSDRNKEEEPVTLTWNKAYGAFRVKGCIYLYATPNKAFLLPDNQADATPDELWAMLAERLRRCYDKR